jgi:hypothetical protein
MVDVHPDVLHRYRKDMAHHHGVTAYRNGQPLADNPYGKATNRDEWHAWNDGWGLMRDVAEHERARAEFAEQACRDAMEAGLARVQELEAALYSTLPEPGTPYVPPSEAHEQATRPERYRRLMERLAQIRAEDDVDPEPDGELVAPRLRLRDTSELFVDVEKENEG